MPDIRNSNDRQAPVNPCSRWIGSDRSIKWRNSLNHRSEEWIKVGTLMEGRDFEPHGPFWQQRGWHKILLWFFLAVCGWSSPMVAPSLNWLESYHSNHHWPSFHFLWKLLKFSTVTKRKNIYMCVYRERERDSGLLEWRWHVNARLSWFLKHDFRFHFRLLRICLGE